MTEINKFNSMYMYTLLNNSNIGGTIGGIVVNHLSYGGIVVNHLSYAGIVVNHLSYAGIVVNHLSYAGIVVNHLSYAGDMCSISLSSHGIIQLCF